MSGAVFHNRCASPWSGRSKPPVPISDPGGPCRIWVVAACGSSLRSPATTTEVSSAASSSVTKERIPAGLCCAAMERVDRLPGALVLVAGSESTAGEGEQLRLQVDRDQVDAAARCPDAGAESRLRNHAVSIITAGNTIDMRVSKDEAAQAKGIITRQMLA